MFEWSDEYILKLIKGIWSGDITTDDLPEPVYMKIAEVLKKGVYEGFGGSLNDYKPNSKDYELLAELRENVYIFSGAKTYQQVRDMTDLLMNGDTVRPFAEFKEEALKVFEQYNTNWLQTEYDTSIGMAQSASKWNDIEAKKETLPYLKYSAVIDGHTSDICRPLDGIIAPVGDKIWGTIAPLNHFNCRCVLEQIDKYEGMELTPEAEKNEKVSEVEKDMKDMFKMNPGKDKVIFSNDHPYFDVAKGDKKAAKVNFNLPIPEKD